MSEHFQSLLPDLKRRMENEFVREIHEDNRDLIAVPYPYITPGEEKKNALYYWDTFFINLGLLRLKMIDQARYNADNLIFLCRKLGFVPASNLKSMLHFSQLPLLPWIIRDIYRATGDKDWLSRVLPDVISEYTYWTNKPHTSPTGLYRFFSRNDKTAEESTESCWITSARFMNVNNYNPLDLNALLYRNAKLIYDFQIEVDGSGDSNLLKKSDQIKRLYDICWDDNINFYFDNNFAEKKLSPIKSLASFVPLFVKMIDNEKAALLQKHIKNFVAPGGLSITDKKYHDKTSAWDYPITCAPYIYFVTKGLSDYDFMEDAADIGTSWLEMVYQIYQQTGEMWEWYNVNEKSTNSTTGIKNTKILGWTAGTFIALLDTLGLA